MAGRLRLGFGTNGLGDHRPGDALLVLAELGYDGVALTLDSGRLDPYDPDIGREVDRTRKLLARLGLAAVVETGGRYVLDPFRKHFPTLLDEAVAAARRVDLLKRAVRIGAELGAEAVSFWSGARPPSVTAELAWDRLVRGVQAVLAEAESTGVTLGFEPEPGMLVDTIDGFERLHELLGSPERLGLTLDIGHCQCLEAQSVVDCVRRTGTSLVNVQIEDMRRGIHEHLEFGEGEIDFPPVLTALGETGYQGLVSVELPRHSHAGPAVAERSIKFLKEVASADSSDR